MKVKDESFTNLTVLADALGLSNTEYSVLSASLSIYFTLTILLGGIGNSLVIYGVWAHNALKMEKRSVLALLCVAVADLVCVVAFYFPRLTTILGGRWVLGTEFCYTTLIRWTEIPCEQSFIALLSCHRAYLIWKPLRGGIPTTVMRNLLILVSVYFTLTYTLETVLIDGPLLKFEPSMFDCEIDVTQINNSSAKFIPYRGFIQTFLPLIAIILANILILAFMGKAGHLRRFHAVKTVSIVCWTFLVSYIPCMALWILKGLSATNTIPTPSSKVFIGLRIATIMSIAINIVANPLIYFYTNEKFAFFIRELLRGDVREFGRSWQNHVNNLSGPTSGNTTNVIPIVTSIVRLSQRRPKTMPPLAEHARTTTNIKI